MGAIVRYLAADLRPKVEAIFCDSKANCCCLVTCGVCSTDDMLEIGHQLERGTAEAGGGHNGIDLGAPGGRSHFLNPQGSTAKASSAPIDFRHPMP